MPELLSETLGDTQYLFVDLECARPNRGACRPGTSDLDLTSYDGEVITQRAAGGRLAEALR